MVVLVIFDRLMISTYLLPFFRYFAAIFQSVSPFLTVYVFVFFAASFAFVFVSGMLRTKPGWIVTLVNELRLMISLYLDPDPRYFSAIPQSVSPRLTLYVFVFLAASFVFAFAHGICRTSPGWI